MNLWPWINRDVPVTQARKLGRGSGFVENETFLNPDIFAGQFYKPAIEILGPCVNGFIFEQEYHPRNDRFPVSKLAQDLDEFFTMIPTDSRYHIELRTEAYLADPVFELLNGNTIEGVPANREISRADLGKIQHDVKTGG